MRTLRAARGQEPASREHWLRLEAGHAGYEAGHSCRNETHPLALSNGFGSGRGDAQRSAHLVRPLPLQGFASEVGFVFLAQHSVRLVHGPSPPRGFDRAAVGTDRAGWDDDGYDLDDFHCCSFPLADHRPDGKSCRSRNAPGTSCRRERASNSNNQNEVLARLAPTPKRVSRPTGCLVYGFSGLLPGPQVGEPGVPEPAASAPASPGTPWLWGV